MQTLNKNLNASAFKNFINRNLFLKIVGGTTLASAALAACSDDDNGPSNADGVDLGSGDQGILNYAFALEQLEAAFYIQVVSSASFATIFTAKEQMMLTEIRDHEVIHREYFRSALGNKAIVDLEPDFSSIDFTNKNSILLTAQTFEDTGVAAYNGAGQLLQDSNLLIMAGKIVSVEGRHAAILRNMGSPKTAAFSGDDVVNTQGLDVAKSPAEILTAVQPYVKTKLNGNNLPTA